MLFRSGVSSGRVVILRSTFCTFRILPYGHSSPAPSSQCHQSTLSHSLFTAVTILLHITWIKEMPLYGQVKEEKNETKIVNIYLSTSKDCTNALKSFIYATMNVYNLNNLKKVFNSHLCE